METHRLNSESRVNTMLQGSIISLCKTMVPFSKTISLNGIICVTIDNTDVLVIDVRDTITNTHSTSTDTLPAQNIKCEVQNRVESSSSVETRVKVENCVTEQASVSKSWVDLSAACDDDEQCYEQVDEYYDEEYDANAEYGYEDTGMEYDATEYNYENEVNEESTTQLAQSSSQFSYKVDASQFKSPARSNKLRGGASMKNKRSFPKIPVKNSFPGSNPPQNLEASDYKSVLPNEVRTTYTCSICGVVVKHYGSFIRHKQKHQGLAFKCIHCGSCFTRIDNRNAHQKKCPMNPGGGQEQGGTANDQTFWQ